jgi:1,4-dihydroxy-6-naphthoate synthase
MDNLSPRLVKVIHSPDSDDAFMFYAILEKKIDLQGFEFEFASDEISKLNDLALQGQDEYQIIALSFATLFKVENDYELMPSGCSFGGKDYGPKIICPEENFEKFTDSTTDLSKFKLAVPGKNTTAFLSTKIYLEENFGTEFEYVYCAYDEVFKLLQEKKVDASLLIHESQLKYKDLGYKLIVDLGVWWHRKTKGLNVPLGCNAIKKDLGKENIDKLNNLLKESIIWGVENFEETLEYSRKFAKNDLDDANASKYLDMYVNETTVELKEDDYKSIEELRKFYLTKV